MTHEENPLVAAVGMGISIVQTKQAAMELSKHEIPMVGAIITADELEHSSINGLIRVSPSNRDYVEILRAHLDNHTNLRSAILVYDSNSDSNGDLFTQNLRDDLKERMGDLIKFTDQAFTGGRPGMNVGAANFMPIIPNICAAEGLDVILYAGRRGDLRGFLDALQKRVCSRTPMTVVTAGIDPTIAQNELETAQGKQEKALREAHLTVVSVERTDARGWGKNEKNPKPGTPKDYWAFKHAFEELKFDSEHLTDDRVMMMHDALLTAAKAVQLAAPGASHPGAPTAAEVFGQLMNLHEQNAVPGATGTLNFSYRKAGAGNPRGKPMLVFQFPSPNPAFHIPEQVGLTYCTDYDVIDARSC